MKRIIPLTVMLMAVALTMSSCTSEKVNIEAEKAVSHNSSTRKTANGSWFTSIIPVGIADYFCISFFLFVLKVLHLCKH